VSNTSHVIHIIVFL